MGDTLYLECTGGISGDMTVAALLDLGADKKRLLEGLNSINDSGFQIKITRVKKSGLDCLDFDVVLDIDNHDHDMDYLYGHNHERSDYSNENEDIGHSHDESENNHHVHRGMSEITKIINDTAFNPNTKEIALKIFSCLANAEAKAHGVPVDEVHFHEVGAIDSIVDILAVAFCIDDLKIDRVIVPYLAEGHGTVRCQHGILPVPVPAVTNIVTDNNIRLTETDIEGELVTPTGAAVVATLRTDDILPERYIIKRIGWGAGKRDYKNAGILRAMIIE